MELFLQTLKKTSKQIATLSTERKNNILRDIAQRIEQNIPLLLEANHLDIIYAKEQELSETQLDRLILNEHRIMNMTQSIKKIIALDDPLGRVKEGWIADNGLNIQKVSVPIGVVAIIYEARPNVTCDAATLCFKSGNIALLKCGKESLNTSQAIVSLFQSVFLENGISPHTVSLFPDTSREWTKKLITMDKYIDLVIPRGGEELIRFISQNSTIPVIKHDKGVCHTYIHSSANFDKAVNIAINAKVQRPGVCNAMETLLVDKAIAPMILPMLSQQFQDHETELRGCEITYELINSKLASELDWETEYEANILSIKVVSCIAQAIEHINFYGSGHSDAIIADDYNAIELFMNEIDSACVYANASTRFTDGVEFGFGAEIGISTNKLHARGPMGLSELTTYKYKIFGHGETR